MLKKNEYELSLSTDINIITAEINAYQRMAGEAIFEIGRRLKHVKENDLVHGEWTKWCDSIGIDDSVARKFIKINDELGERYTYTDLGMNALYHIATFPEDQREQPHTIPSTGETKTVDEMTVRELREIKKKLKEEEEYRKLVEEENSSLQKRLKEADSKQPEVIQKVVHVEKEVDKTDYDAINRLKSQIEKTLKENERLSNSLNTIRQQNDLLEERLEQEASDANEKRKLEKELEMLKSQKGDVVRQFEAAKELGNFQAKVQVFLLEEMSPMAYSKAKLEIRDSPALKDSFIETLTLIEDWLRNMKKEVGGSHIVGEIIDMEMNN